jgi:hypothetical protein
MDTCQLRVFQQPQRAQDLLESFAWAQIYVPAHADRVRSRAELTPALRRLAARSESRGSAWLGWTDNGYLWLLTATPSLELSRERRQPVLQVQVFNEPGELTDSLICVYGADHKWRRCA